MRGDAREPEAESRRGRDTPRTLRRGRGPRQDSRPVSIVKSFGLTEELGAGHLDTPRVNPALHVLPRVLRPTPTPTSPSLSGFQKGSGGASRLHPDTPAGFADIFEADGHREKNTHVLSSTDAYTCATKTPIKAQNIPESALVPWSALPTHLAPEAGAALTSPCCRPCASTRSAPVRAVPRLPSHLTAALPACGCYDRSRRDHL